MGELTVRGPYTIRGYYRLPEHNAKAFMRGRLLPHRRPGQPRQGRLPGGGGPRQGPDQPRRREDRRGRGGEPADSPSAGARRHRRGDAPTACSASAPAPCHPAPTGAPRR
ncbi:hypothetical protein ACPA9J_24005 [Pseudomonas aeruginosa]